MKARAIGSWVLPALVFSSSCLAPVGDPLPDGGDAGPVSVVCRGGMSCVAPETCDPIDGLCKCGPELLADGGAGLVVCGPNEICDPTFGTCAGSFCYMKICSNGNICDLQDGVCKCGGQVCPDNQVCDTTSHLCQ